MSVEDNPKLVADNLVVSMAYTLTVDGELIAETEDGESLQFIQGYGSIIPGLEKAITGMAEGERRAIKVAAEDAYGQYDIEQIDNIPMTEFPEEIELVRGLELELEDSDGDILYGRIISVGKSRVKMDFNHPLAGEDLEFDVTILALRTATEQELEQGFVE